LHLTITNKFACYKSFAKNRQNQELDAKQTIFTGLVGSKWEINPPSCESLAKDSGQRQLAVSGYPTEWLVKQVQMLQSRLLS